MTKKNRESLTNDVNFNNKQPNENIGAHEIIKELQNVNVNPKNKYHLERQSAKKDDDIL